MKKLLILLAFLSVFQINAQEKKVLGVGLGGGNIISGISLKYYLTDKTAAQGIVGFIGGGDFALGADYLMEMPDYLIDNKDVTLSWYFGGGFSWIHYSWYYDGSTRNWEILGINGMIGLSLRLKKVPLEFTTEWRPGFFIDTYSDKNYNGYYNGLYLGGGGGAIRWYF